MSSQPVRLLPVLRARESPYSYRCNACSRCCHGRGIQVNPYELARLARSRRLGTTELVRQFTREQGTLLAQRPDGACVFLTEHGCGVHADRPLVCRLYPLGRIARADGSEAFVELEPHPLTEGVTGQDGTVAEYLEAQGAGPFLEAARRYHQRFRRMAALAATSAGTDGPHGDPAGDARDAAALLDVDRAVEEHCRSTGEAPPATVEERVALHLRLLDRWIDSLESPGRASAAPIPREAGAS